MTQTESSFIKVTRPSAVYDGTAATRTTVDDNASADLSEAQHNIFFAAVETTRMPMTVTDPRQPDCPIIFANRAFLEQHNPQALRSSGERLLEAMQRGLWQDPREHRERIEQTLLALDHRLETQGEGPTT